MSYLIFPRRKANYQSTGAWVLASRLWAVTVSDVGVARTSPQDRGLLWRATLSGAVRGAAIGSGVVMGRMIRSILLAWGAGTVPDPSGELKPFLVWVLRYVSGDTGTLLGLLVSSMVYLIVWSPWRPLGRLGREGMRVVVGIVVCYFIDYVIVWQLRIRTAYTILDRLSTEGALAAWWPSGQTASLLRFLAPAVYAVLFAGAARRYVRRGIWTREQRRDYRARMQPK